MKKFQAVRGMNDILPTEIHLWQYLESVFRELTAAYGYQEIRYPIVEQLTLFKRTIGEVTDIVEKEMYEFEDRNGDHLALRPEGTAGCVRAAVENGMVYNQTQKLWYIGPMFRRERPQKGRYRQFYQFGLEALGFDGPDIDAEIILLTARLWERLGLNNKLTLQLNTLGTPAVRERHREALVAYFEEHEAQLDDDSKRRLTTNPLRILDSKNPDLKDLNQAAPSLMDFLDEESKTHFDQLCTYLNAVGIAYDINPCLVRGLDYYAKTVFEWVSGDLGAQATVCAGGRYDGLVEQLGGQSTPAIGFALGLERLIALLQMDDTNQPLAYVPDVYLVLVGEKAKAQGLLLAEKLHDVAPPLRVITHCGEGSMKNQFKRADKSGASIALVMGDDEVEQATVTVKYLREKRDQETVALENIDTVILNMNL